MRAKRAMGAVVVCAAASWSVLLAGCGDDAVSVAGTEPTMADMAGDSGTPMDMTGHDHDHMDMGDLTQWPGETAPTLMVQVTPHEGGDVHIALMLSGFELLASGAEATSPTQGHVHVSVDGAAAQMYFEPEFDLVGVSPGPHQVSVTLSAPDHTTYAVDGEPLVFTEDFVVPGEVAAADVVIPIVVDADGHVSSIVEAEAKVGQVVKVTVDSAVAEELHVHAYDRMLDFDAGVPAELQFTADIPGVFEIELEGSGTLVAELTVR